MGGAAVVVKDMITSPRTISYTIPASKPATQPVLDAPANAQPTVTFLAGAHLKELTLGDAVVIGPPCSHLEKNQNLATTVCANCHSAKGQGLVTVRLAREATLTPQVKAGTVLLNGITGELTLTSAQFAANVLIDLVDTNGLAAGTDAPAIDVKQSDGTKLTLADFKGRYVLLQFWDSTSKESAEQMPHLRAAQKEWDNEPKLVIVGINVDEKPEAATAFAKEQKMEWTQGYAGAGSKLMKDYHVGVGAAVLIGPDGKIVNGSLSGLAIDDALDKALRPQ